MEEQRNWKYFYKRNYNYIRGLIVKFLEHMNLLQKSVIEGNIEEITKMKRLFEDCKLEVESWIKGASPSPYSTEKKVGKPPLSVGKIYHKKEKSKTTAVTPKINHSPEVLKSRTPGRKYKYNK